MEFIKGYMNNDAYRHLLNDMTGTIFGFSFENWYQAGFFEGEYIPYSYMENGRIVANASANIMKFAYNGEEKFYIQIGTVMTRSEYRNQGLARSLIEKILHEYADRVDGFYLFGNLNAVDFYKRIGFKRLDQWRWLVDDPLKSNLDSKGFYPAGKELREKYVKMLKTAAINASFDHINRCSLQMFYTMEMEDVYYCKELDCFAAMHAEDKVLYLDSIISNKEVSIEEVIRQLGGEYSKIVFGFTPKEKLKFNSELYDGEDDYRLFYLGSQLECIERDKLYFPIMSHA